MIESWQNNWFQSLYFAISIYFFISFFSRRSMCICIFCSIAAIVSFVRTFFAPDSLSFVHVTSNHGDNFHGHSNSDNWAMNRNETDTVSVWQNERSMQENQDQECEWKAFQKGQTKRKLLDICLNCIFKCIVTFPSKQSSFLSLLFLVFGCCWARRNSDMHTHTHISP